MRYAAPLWLNIFTDFGSWMTGAWDSNREFKRWEAHPAGARQGDLYHNRLHPLGRWENDCHELPEAGRVGSWKHHLVLGWDHYHDSSGEWPCKRRGEVQVWEHGHARREEECEFAWNHCGFADHHGEGHRWHHALGCSKQHRLHRSFVCSQGVRCVGNQETAGCCIKENPYHFEGECHHVQISV